MNTLYILLDGAEDDPCPQLGGEKPIDVAETPFLRTAVSHRYRTEGRAYTHLFLNEFFTGHPPDICRAALEALGLGLSVRGNRVAYRLSPARIDDGIVRWLYRTADIRDELEARVRSHLPLLSPYDPEIRFFIEGRAVLTMDSDYIPVTPAPPVDAPLVEIEGPLGELINSVAEEMDITLYPWGCGRLSHQYPPFEGLRNLTAISDSPTSLGICSSLGFRIRLEDDLESRFPIAATALEEGDVFLHVDEVDEVSHQRDPFAKVDVLELTDRLLEKHFSDAERIVCFADHGTSCVTGQHIVRDVPLWCSFDLGLAVGETVPLNRVVPIVSGMMP